MSNLPATTVVQQGNLPVVTQTGELNLFNPDVLKNLEALSTKVAQSSLIPAHYRGKPADCFIALYRAGRAGVDPFAWMEQTYVVHNKLGMQAQLVIALLNSSGQFKNNVQWNIAGDESDITKMSATAWVIRKDTEIKCEGYCSFSMAEAEGWVTNNAKWRTLTRLMLMYRSAAFLMRTHCPEIGLGIKTVDEIEDSERQTVLPDGGTAQQLFTRPTEEPAAAVSAQAAAVDAEVTPVTDAPENKTATLVVPATPVDEKKTDAVPAAVAEPTIAELKKIIRTELKIDCQEKEESLSAYLVSINWLNPGELFESLQDMYVTRIHKGIGNFNLQFYKWRNEKKAQKNGGKK